MREFAARPLELPAALQAIEEPVPQLALDGGFQQKESPGQVAD
jgi:hypothetical protein